MKWYVGPDGERGRFTEGAPVPQGWIEETVLVPAGPFDAVVNTSSGRGGFYFRCRFGASQIPTSPRLFVKGKAKKAEKAKPAKAKRK